MYMINYNVEPSKKEAAAPMPAEAADAEPAPEGPKKKTIKVLGFQVFSATENGAKKALIGGATFLVGLNILGLPFILPKLRIFLGAPYVPMKRPF